jgi:hypothetical protein
MLRCAFAGLLSFALAASGATLGLAQIAMAQPSSENHIHHAAAHSRHEHHGHPGMAQSPADKETPQAGDHASKTCCSACTVTSALPCIPDAAVALVVSRALYPNPKRFEVAHATPIDPGIPKRIG